MALAFLWLSFDCVHENVYDCVHDYVHDCVCVCACLCIVTYVECMNVCEYPLSHDDGERERCVPLFARG